MKSTLLRSLATFFLLLLLSTTNAADIQLKWLEPGATPGACPAYAKLELGIDLPETFDRLISFHMRDSRHPLARNPFDPEVMDVWAKIEFESKPGVWSDERINCFYYMDYRRNHNYTEDFTDKVPSSHPADHYGHWDWIEEETTYNFRMRYAPRVVGNYRLVVTCAVDKHTLKSDTLTFVCEASDHPGYVQRAGQSGYFEHQDGSAYFPAGHQINAIDRQMDWDLPWALCQVYDENCQPVYTTNSKGERIPKREKCCEECVPSKQPWSEIDSGTETIAQISFVNMLDELQLLHESGGNTARVMFFPWSHELEYEKLGSYQDRMHCAWEFDQFIDKATELDMYVQWQTQAQYMLGYNPFGIMQNWDWAENYPPGQGKGNAGYCYARELNLTEPLEFFTNPKAIKWYQKKLRYYIARWGYSPNISVIELFSEVNSIQRLDAEGGIKNLYNDEDPFAREALANWHHTMADYIKNALGHRQHLIGTSYLLNGPSKGDNTYSDSLIDVLCESRYNGGRGEFWKSGTDRVNALRRTYDKPVMWSEFGHDHHYLKCTRPVNAIKGMMLTPFSGVAGMGYDWDNMANPDQDHWKYYQHVTSFLAGIDFTEGDWKATVGSIREDERALSTNVRAADDRVVGAVYNCTWNEYSANGCGALGCKPCECDTVHWSFGDYTLSWEGLETPQIVTSGDARKANRLRVRKMPRGKYTVRWYDPFSGKSFTEVKETKARLELVKGNLGRNLVLEYPPLNPDKHPILYFEVSPIE